MEKIDKNIAIACDHAGFELKEAVKAFLTENQYIVKDYGTNSPDSVDYPDMVHPLGRDINNGVFERGIVICGTGNGVQMTVNKYPNVRCALCWIPEIAKLARQHNNANILSMPARFIDKDTAIQIVNEYLNTDFEGGRHERRVEKINHTLK
ncbi:MAG: ribose 5-phosphate isomerase B [Bacteroidales bacterium]|nr:ribose 5-phosphate isomerase B [Bacteroidales bacterium]